MIALRHHGGSDQRRHAGLTHRDDMRARPDRLQKLDQMGDIIVEAEPAGRHRNVTGIVPVGDIDVMLRQHGAHGPAQERREMARERRHDQDARLGGFDVLFEAKQRAERGDMGHLLGDLDLRLPTMTLRMP